MAQSTAAFHEALELVDRLPEDQQRGLVEILQRRQSERRREALAASIQEARAELAQGEVRRGTVDDLLAELED